MMIPLTSKMRPRLTPLLRALAIALTSVLIAPGLQAQTLPDYVIEAFGARPAVPDTDLSPELASSVRTVFLESVAPVGSVTQFIWGAAQQDALVRITAAKDPRLVWLISDLMQFTWQDDISTELADAAATLLGKTWGPGDPWNAITDHMIAWDIPAPPGYLATKRRLYTTLLHGWDRLFVAGAIDWRHVSWGGVPIDARAYDTTDIPCTCIPAVDNPAVTRAEDATWLADDAIIFGIEVNGAYRAYPRQIMEVREMVNDTLGGRDLGIPYCTLCGAAQAYFTDDLPAGIDRPILRTSGLLIRSNKVMFDLATYSIFDTFRGIAVTGPLADRGVKLPQATVITTDWGTWKATYPDTTVLAENLALGRNFDFRAGRDANGPIFPVGDVDPRLPIQEDVIGVLAASGTPIAFPRGPALLALKSGQDIRFENVQLQLDAGGLRAVDAGGRDLASHQAFWFAWSQFHPTTKVWRSP